LDISNSLEIHYAAPSRLLVILAHPSSPCDIDLLLSTDVFLGLNVVRLLSMIACILVLASNIITLVEDVKAVNKFEATEGNNPMTESNDNSIMVNMNYIPCVVSLLSLFW